MIEHVFFDIDNCLIANIKSAPLLTSLPKNLSQIKIKINGQKVTNLYAINLEPMRQIFQTLLANDIKIAFITSSEKTKSFLEIFEYIYDLPKGALQDSIFINRDAYNSKLSKGAKIAKAQQLGLITKEKQNILVVEDQIANIRSIQQYGYQTIHCCAFPERVDYLLKTGQGRMNVNNDYLQEIVAKCELGLDLPIEPVENNIASFKLNDYPPDYIDQKHMDLSNLSIDVLEKMLLHACMQKKERVFMEFLYVLLTKAQWQNFTLDINRQCLWGAEMFQEEFLINMLQIFEEHLNDDEYRFSALIEHVKLKIPAKTLRLKP